MTRESYLAAIGTLAMLLARCSKFKRCSEMARREKSERCERGAATNEARSHLPAGLHPAALASGSEQNQRSSGPFMATRA